MAADLIDDTPLIYQFASHDPFELAEASKYVVGYEV